MSAYYIRLELRQSYYSFYFAKNIGSLCDLYHLDHDYYEVENRNVYIRVSEESYQAMYECIGKSNTSILCRLKKCLGNHILEDTVRIKVGFFDDSDKFHLLKKIELLKQEITVRRKPLIHLR